MERSRDLIAKTARTTDCIITSAAIPGRRAPLLITEAAVQAMKHGSVIVNFFLSVPALALYYNYKILAVRSSILTVWHCNVIFLGLFTISTHYLLLVCCVIEFIYGLYVISKNYAYAGIH